MKVRDIAALRAHQKPSLPVIDKIARRPETNWENTMLFGLLNQRYGDLSDTFPIGTLMAADLESSVGPSIASPMNERDWVIECDWPLLP